MSVNVQECGRLLSRLAVLGLCGLIVAACSTSRFGSQEPSYLSPPQKIAQPAPSQPHYVAPQDTRYQAPPPRQSFGPTITVARGDTLYSLSRRHGVSVNAIMAENQMSGTTLSVGQTLRLPHQR